MSHSQAKSYLNILSIQNGQCPILGTVHFVGIARYDEHHFTAILNVIPFNPYFRYPEGFNPDRVRFHQVRFSEITVL